jgi:hypothetical protein
MACRSALAGRKFSLKKPKEGPGERYGLC